MTVYVVRDDKCNIIAFHEDRDVCEEYVKNVWHTNKIILEIKKVKHFNVIKNEMLYLVPHEETYIQHGYLDYLNLVESDLIKDQQVVVNLLNKILICRKLKKGDVKNIRKVILLLEDLLYEDERYTPTLNELKSIKLDYEPYIYNMEG